MGPLRWLGALAAATALTVFAYALLVDVNTGPVVVTFAPGHGLHARDLAVLAGWAVGVLGLLTCLLLAPGRGRRRRS